MSKPFMLSLYKTVFSSFILIILLVFSFTVSGCGGGGGGSASMPGTGPMVTPEEPEPAEPMLNTGLGENHWVAQQPNG